MNKKENQPSSALISYAVFADRILRGGDLLQSLMPFFRPIAVKYAGEYFNAGNFCQMAAEHYALQIPQLTVLGWCERLTKEGLLELDRKVGAKNLYRYPQEIPVDKDTPAGVSEQQVLDFLAGFRKFAKQSSAEELASLDDDALDEALFTRLLNIDSMSILSRRESATQVKEKASTLSLKNPTNDIDTRHEIHLDFLVAEYLSELEATDSNKFEVAAAVTFGNMAAEALATFRAPPDSEKTSLSGMRLYLDTPIVLDLLGLNEGFEEYANEIKKLLLLSGVKIAVFDHSVEEIQGVVYAKYKSNQTNINNSSISNTRGLMAHRLALINGNVPSKLEELGIEIDSDPNISLIRISQNALGSAQASLDKKMHGWKADAKQRDQQSIFNLIALRSRQRIESDFSKCQYALLTRNTPLGLFANSTWRQWLQESGNGKESMANTERAAPLVVSDKQLSGLLWMLRGGGSKSLPKARLISHCSSAIRPRQDVINTACNLIVDAHGRDKGIEFSALLTNRRAEQALMRAITGDPEELTPQNLPLIIKQVTLAAGAEAAAAERAIADEEARRAAASHQEALAIRDATLSNRDLLLSSIKNDFEDFKFKYEIDNSIRDANEREKNLQILHLKIEGLQTKLNIAMTAHLLGKKYYRRLIIIFWVLACSIITLLQSLFPELPLIYKIIISSSFLILNPWLIPNLIFGPICKKLATKNVMEHLAPHKIKIPPGSTIDFSQNKYQLVNDIESQIDSLKIMTANFNKTE